MACSLIAAPAYAGDARKKLKNSVEKIEVAPDAAKAAGSHNCHCEITCKSAQTGATFTGNQTDIGSGYSWPIGPSKHDDCSNRCLGFLQDNAQSTAEAGKLCKTGDCSGHSWIGTGTGGDRYTVSNVNFDNSRLCDTPPPGTAAACCAPIGLGDVDTQFTINQAPLGAANPYYVTFAANNTALNNKMNAFANLAGLVQSGCNPSTIVYKLTNTATNAVVLTFTATYTGGSGTPTISPSPAAIAAIAIPAPNPAVLYKLTATAGCTNYTSKDCKDRGFTRTLGHSSFRTTGGVGNSSF